LRESFQSESDQSAGYNSIRTLSARLKYFHAVSGGLLSTLPLELRLRGKSTAQSHRAAIYYVDLTIRSGTTMAESLAAAKALSEERKAAGFDQAALDKAAKQGFAEGAFEESEEEGLAVMEEFYPDSSGAMPTDNQINLDNKVDLATKLSKKAEQLKIAQESESVESDRAVL
jgi:hypothetical protein